MPKDAKLDEIELKRNDFNTSDQETVAERLKEEWPANFKDLEEQFGDYSRSTYQKVYNEYFGPVDYDSTVSELREEFGTVKRFIEARDRGDLPDDDVDEESLSRRELKLYQEGFKEGWREAMREKES